MMMMMGDYMMGYFWKFWILENYRILNFLTLENQCIIIVVKRGYNPPVVAVVVVRIGVGFCAGLPAGGKSLTKSL